MQVFVIRHAHAVVAAENAERPLSERGRKQVRRLARLLRKTGALPLTEVWHSPLLRSKETAELLIDGLCAKAKLTQIDGIEGEDDPNIIAERLRTRRSPVAIVGHEPHLSALVSLLVAGRTAPRKVVIKKSAVLALERSAENDWVIVWHVSPAIVP